MDTKPEEPTLHELASRLAELEQANVRLHEELTSLQAERAAVEEQARPQPLARARKRSRRRMLTRGLGVAVATVGAGTLLELSSGTASAAAGAKPGVFASNVAGTPAVSATGTNGADGVGATSDSGNGVFGISTSSIGVRGRSSSNEAVFGQSTSGNGLRGISDSGAGVVGQSTSSAGVFGSSSAGLAGLFAGDVQVTGTLTKKSGSFKIDHPLDPAHKYLSHSFVESPDMKNIYDGVVTLDANGEAEVRLPAWFDALNTEFRYQLTCLGGYAPVYIVEEIRGNRFKIAGGQAGMRVSWQVSGIRQDAWANAHRIPVEQDKPAQEQGFYLYPELYGQSEQQSGVREHHPDLPLPSTPR